MKPKLVQLVCVALCGGLLVGATRLMPGIDQGRAALTMIGTRLPAQNVTPEMALLLQGLGAFRGILTSILFIRAEHYKDLGRYYDAKQLADLICTLQPRFPSVWEFQAWNMAWNISVTTYTPEERWNWVYNGVKLLRDKGIARYNPRSVNLYKQLAWIFVNKMSETTDEFHMTYKRNWAHHMHLLLGPPPDPLGQYRPDTPVELPAGGIGQDELAASVRRTAERQAAERGAAPTPGAPPAALDRSSSTAPAVDSAGIVRKASYDMLRAVADAPAQLPELYRHEPAAREMVSRLRELGARITDDVLDEDHYWSEAGLRDTFFLPYRKLADEPPLLERVLDEEQRRILEAARDARLETFDGIVGVRERRPAGQALLRFLQRKVLREVYKLEPAEMADLVRTFGPMDWRVVDAHSLYWINRGLIAGEETISSFKNDKTNTARLIFFSLRNLSLRNKLIYEPLYEDVNYSYLNFTPDLNFIEPMHQAFLTYGPMIDPEPVSGQAGGTFRTGHVSFLTEATRTLYFAGHVREADRYFRYLIREYGTLPDGSVHPLYAKTLHDFVVDTFLESDLAWKDTRAAIDALILHAYEELADGNRERFAEYIGQARAFHTRFHQNDDYPLAEKLKMPPFLEMARDVLGQWLTVPATHPLITLRKVRLWHALPLELARAVYDDLGESLARESQNFGFEPRRSFPEPPGMTEYRAAHPRRGPQPEQRPQETPAQQLN
jgi:hypothetical protein